MTFRPVYHALAFAAFAGLVACQPADPVSQGGFSPVYRGIETHLLDVDLVNVRVAMTGARDNEDVASFARCVAAQYALKRGYGFARHVRTNVAKEAGVWRGDAVYTISPVLPKGLRTIDAEVTVQNCAEERIPTV